MLLFFIVAGAGCLLSLWLWWLLAQALDSALNTTAFTSGYRVVIALFAIRAVYKTGKRLYKGG